MKPPVLDPPVLPTPSENVALSEPLNLPPDLRKELTRLRSHRRSVAIAVAVITLGSTLCLLWLVQAYTDWEIALPWLVRALFLIADGALLVWIYRRFHPRVFRQQLGLSTVALAAEHRWPQLGQSLISAVELAEGKPGATRGSYQLALRAIDVAWLRTRSVKFNELVPWRRLRFWTMVGGLVLVATVVAVMHLWPYSPLLLQRILLSTASQTAVTPITENLSAPLGHDVKLQARASGRMPTEGHVTVEFEGEPAKDLPVSLDADHPDTFSLTIPNVQKSFAYRFHLNDGQTVRFQVDAETPPALASLTCHVVYPAYTGLPEEDRATGNLSLLAGSRLQLNAAATQNLRSATIFLVGETPPRTIGMKLDPSGKTLTGEIPIPENHLTGFSVHLVNAGGFPSSDETIYSVFPVPDHPPLVDLNEPRLDRMTLVAEAKPTLVASAHDDYGIAKLSLMVELIPRGARPTAGHPWPVQEIPLPLIPGKSAKAEYVFDLSSLTPLPTAGATLDYWITATDNNDVTGPGVTSSRHKHFDIVTLADKEKEINERLQQAANSLDSVAGEQDKVTTQVGDALHH